MEEENQVTTAGEWKRRFQRETKVNKELGRRLRETKHQLEEEKTRAQELAAQLRHYKRHQHLDEKPNIEDVCLNCEGLETEVARLKRIIIDAGYMTKHELASTSLTLISEGIRPEKNERTPENHCSEFKREDTNGLQPENSEDTPPIIREPSCPSSPVNKPQPTTSSAHVEDTLRIEDPEADESNQTDDDCHVFTDIDDSSLGDLFKYAVVLAGPAPSKPKVKPRLSFTDRFKPLDLQRIRNPQESLEQIEHQESPTDNSNRPRSAPVGKKKAASPNGGIQELEGLLEICFPYGEEPPLTRDFSLSQLKRSLQERHRTYRSPDSTFVLTIASASNPTEITYAICVRCPLFPDKDDDNCDPADSKSEETQSLADGPAQCCLCLLSPYPFFGLFFKVLYGIAVLWNTKRREAVMAKKDKTSDSLTTMLEKPLGMLDFVEVFQGVMERLKEMQIPSMGGWSRMVLSLKVTHLAFHRPHSESLVVERRHLLLEYAAPTLFGLLSVDQVLFLLGCLCSERKVLVVSDHVNIVSSCVLALITLLHPLQWAGPVITVLPPRLDELLEAPVPLIAGRVSINSASIRNFSTLDRPMRDVIEMNMDQNSLHMHDEDLITYHELKLPECDELVHELEPYSALLFGKHEAPDFPTVQQDEACKIMCARIHHHIESICALAMTEIDTTTLIRNDYFDQLSDRSSPDTSSPSRGSITRLGADRRCSAMVADYINRFQGTQMFSMFNLQAQDAQNESDEGDVDRDDSENDGHVDEEYHYEGN
ncbi:hypothetical protein PC110_g14102 [Phytophthora cactorum]|uniref:UDENN domain-containing protein n=1 Tax=Phytophthora cactorum TaxID=29920 RepID=A0A329S1K9_9STRA|nr:hypothetical protein PC110_g14102 [Phytophthora cactorum]